MLSSFRPLSSGHRKYLACALSAVGLAVLSACGGGGGGGAVEQIAEPLSPASPDVAAQEAVQVVAVQSLTADQEIDRLRQLGMSVVPLDDKTILEDFGDDESFQFTPVDMPTTDKGILSVGSAQALSASAGEGRATPLIVGGASSQPGQFPFFARLAVNFGTSSGSCSGAIIDANWILTQAHCTPNSTAGSVSVYLGYGSTSVAPETIPADYYVKLPNDQALVHLSRPTTYPKLPYAGTFSATAGPVRTVGAGVDVYGGSMGYYKFVDNTEVSLNPAYPGYFVLGTPGSMTTSCSGDSGGPNLLYSSSGLPYVIGGTSATLYPYCTGQALVSRVDMIAPNIEAITGVPPMQFNLANNPPKIQQIQPLETPLQYTEFQVVASDAEGDEILYEAKGLPAGLSIHRLTGLIRGTPTSYTFGGQPSQVTVTAYDKTTGGSRSITFPWRINTPGNLSPEFVTGNPTSRTIVAGQSVSLQFIANDPDDSSIQFSATGLPPGVTISSTGLIAGTPAAGGVYQANIVAVDGRGGYASVPFLLTVQNTAPVIAPIADVASAPGATNFKFTVGVSDAEGQALTVSTSTLPAGVTFDSSKLEFSGSPKAAGGYPISVRVTDGYGGSTSRSFVWYASSANNTAPTMDAIASRTSLPGVPVTVPLTGMVDAEGHAMTLTFKNLPVGIRYNATAKALSGTPTRGGVYNVEYTISDAYGGKTAYAPMVWTIPNEAPIISGPSTASLLPGVAATIPFNLFDPENHPVTVATTNMPRGLLFNTITKAITGTPQVGGLFVVTLTATDKYGAKSSTNSIAINIPNEAPVVAAKPADRTIPLGTVVNEPLSVSDPENHPITISALPRTLPYGLAINQTTRSITGKPVAAGTYIIKLIATDRFGAKTEFPGFTWTTTNAAPVWGTIGDLTAMLGTAVNIPLPVTDPDGHTVIVTSTTLPGGLRITGNAITGTPTAGAGVFTVSLYAKDQYGLTSPEVKTIRLTIASPG